MVKSMKTGRKRKKRKTKRPHRNQRLSVGLPGRFGNGADRRPPSRVKSAAVSHPVDFVIEFDKKKKKAPAL